MSHQVLVRLLASIAIVFAVTAQAEVLRSSESGFAITQSVTVTMPPQAAWSALSDIGRWWDPEHTFSGDARNLTLDPFVGGCFCEKLGMYAGVQHMRVVFAKPPLMLRMSGGLGPLQGFAVNGTMTWTIEVAGGGSKLTMSYVVGGYADRPLSEWAPLVDSVMATQVQRLGRFISTGNPVETKGESKPDFKPDAKPDTKPDTKPESKPGSKPESPTKRK